MDNRCIDCCYSGTPLCTYCPTRPSDFSKSIDEMSGYVHKNFTDYTKKHKRITPPMPVIFPEISKVIFSEPATIVYWSDGTRTVVKVQEGDVFDPEKGLAMAISKKAFGNSGSYYRAFDKWIGKYDKENESKFASAITDLQKACASAAEKLSFGFWGKGEKK